MADVVASGVGPYFGQAVHFRNYAPEKLPYAINRYAFEAKRHFGILDNHLAKRRYMLGDIYTIVDMDVWGWARLIRPSWARVHGINSSVSSGSSMRSARDRQPSALPR